MADKVDDVVFPVAASDDDDDALSRSLAAKVRRPDDDGRKDLDTRPPNMASLDYNFMIGLF